MNRHWLYLNSAFASQWTQRIHKGQLGLVDGLRSCGEDVTIDVTQTCPYPVPEVALPSAHYGDLQWVLEETTIPVVLPWVPPIDAAEQDLPALCAGFLARIPFVWGQAESPGTQAAYANIGIPYYVLPFGCSWVRTVHESPVWSWGFAGNMGHRGEQGIEYILQLVAKTPVETPYWLVGHGWSSAGVEPLLSWEVVMLRYQETAVCPNCHCDEQKHPGLRQDVNQRLFDLAAIGACQVVDWFPLIDEYFADDEVVKAKSQDEWSEQVLWYAVHPRARADYQQRAAKRVQAEHTWSHRARHMLRWVAEAEGRVIPGQETRR